MERARSVLERANNTLRNGEKEDRLQLLRAWQTFEKEHGDEASQAKVNKLMPQLIKKRIRYVSDDGVRIFLNRYINTNKIINLV